MNKITNMYSIVLILCCFNLEGFWRILGSCLHFARFFSNFTLFFVDQDECSTEFGNCTVNAKCINTEGSFYCECNNGYVGNGSTCEGIAHDVSTSLMTERRSGCLDS